MKLVSFCLTRKAIIEKTIMTNLGIAVGEEMWMFFKEIYDDLTLHYNTSIFHKKEYHVPLLHGRLNRWSYKQGLHSILKQNDLCFFEWASEHLVIASNFHPQTPIVTRLHSFELYDWAPKVNWDSVSKVILISKYMQDKFNELYPQHSHKSIVINNGRSMKTFTPPIHRTYDYNLGMMCAILPVKRIYEVILMLYELRKSGLPARLRIAGKAKEMGDFRYPVAVHELIKKLYLEDFVIFDGFVVDTPSWLQNIDIFISNSFWEGQQVALIEAMACGCYCLSHFWNGSEEMLPPENIFITNSDLQQKIIGFYNTSDAEKAAYSQYFRAIALEKYDLENIKIQIHQVIEEVL